MDNIEETLLGEVIPEDIGAPQKELVAAIGMGAFIQGCREIGGAPWYFPTVRNLVYAVKKRKVREEYNGTNAKKLAAKYNMAESSVHKIIAESRSQRRKSLP